MTITPMPEAIHRSVDNPFVYTRPVFERERAIVRTRELNEAVTSVLRGEYVSVLTPRQGGKTTFLFHLKQTLDEDRFPAEVIRLDFRSVLSNDFSDVVRFFRKSIAESHADIKDLRRLEDAEDFIEMLDRLSAIKPFIFLLDELPRSRELAFLLLSVFRSYQGSANRFGQGLTHGVVVAGSTDLVYLTADLDPQISPFNIANRVYLGDFTEQQVTDFVRRRAGEAFSDTMIRKIFDYTCGHPFLMQYVCHNLWDRQPTERQALLDNLPTLIDRLRVDATLNIQTIMNRLGGKGSPSEHLLKTVLQGGYVPFTLTLRDISDLELAGLLIEKVGRCAIRNPIYEQVLWQYFIAESKLVSDQRHYEDYFARLKNFQGWISISITDGKASVHYDRAQRRFTLQSESQYELRVIIAKGNIPFELPPTEAIFQPLAITHGEEPTTSISFSVRPESFYDFGFGDEQTRTFAPHMPESTETFRFPFVTGTPTPGQLQLFVNIYQEVSLVEVVGFLAEVVSQDAAAPVNGPDNGK